MTRMVPIILYLIISTEWMVLLNIRRALKLLLGKHEVSWRELQLLMVLNMPICLQALNVTRLIKPSDGRT